MKCGPYMCLTQMKPSPPQEEEDPKCVLEYLCRIWRPHFYRHPNDNLQTHILGGLGVQCKILPKLLEIPLNRDYFE